MFLDNFPSFCPLPDPLQNANIIINIVVSASLKKFFLGGNTLGLVSAGLPHTLGYACTFVHPPVPLLTCTVSVDAWPNSKAPEGHYPGSTTLREALQGNFCLSERVLRGLYRVSPRVLRNSAGVAGVRGILLSWGGLQRHGLKNIFEFLTFFETRQKGHNVNGFLPQPPLLDQSNARTRRARLAKNMQEHVFIDVPRPGNMLAVRGGYTRMRPCRQCHGNGSHESQTPPPPTKGCRQPGPKEVKKSVNFFLALKSGSACGPSNVFFTKKFRTFFTVLPEGFCMFFSRFFRTFFALFFARFFSQDFSHVPFTHFSDTFFIAVCCPKGFHSLQSQHCVTVPETGHTTTCRSSPSLLTQYSHKQVEKMKVFGKISAKFSLSRQSAITFCKGSVPMLVMHPGL